MSRDIYTIYAPPFVAGDEVFVRFCGRGSETLQRYLTGGGFWPGISIFQGKRFIHPTRAACEADDSVFLVTRATFTGWSRVSQDGTIIWEIRPIEFTDYPLSALATRRDSPTGHDRAPDRYTTQGRETIDRQRDAAGALFEEAIEAGLDDGDAAFYVHCQLTALKYEDRLGRKDPDDAGKAAWYQKMAAHLLGAGEDPRAGRADFVPYARSA